MFSIELLCRLDHPWYNLSAKWQTVLQTSEKPAKLISSVSFKANRWWSL